MNLDKSSRIFLEISGLSYVSPFRKRVMRELGLGASLRYISVGLRLETAG